jgi:hypothetical protein
MSGLDTPSCDERVPMKRVTIPAGSLIRIGSIPFYVTGPTEVESHPDNVASLTGCSGPSPAPSSERKAPDPSQTVPDGMWYFTFYCEDKDAVQRVRIAANAPRQFTCGVTGVAKKEAGND